MTDIAVHHNGYAIDVQRAGVFIQADNSLYSEVVIRLFTDRRAPDDYDLNGDDPRGSWSDSMEDEELGSLLWMLRREKLLPDLPRRAEQYAFDALKSLVTQKKAKSVEVRAEIRRPSTLALFPVITLPDGSTYEPFPKGLIMEL